LRSKLGQRVRKSAHIRSYIHGTAQSRGRLGQRQALGGTRKPVGAQKVRLLKQDGAVARFYTEHHAGSIAAKTFRRARFMHLFVHAARFHGWREKGLIREERFQMPLSSSVVHRLLAACHGNSLSAVVISVACLVVLCRSSDASFMLRWDPAAP
jgi:hypothetical protein